MSDFSAKGYCHKCRKVVALDDGPMCDCTLTVVCDYCGIDTPEETAYEDDGGLVICEDCLREEEDSNG